MAIKFSDRVFGANVDSDIIKEFQKLAGGGISKTEVRDEHGMPVIVKGEGRVLEEIKPTFKKYLGDRTPFARMWTPLLIEGTNKKEIVYHTINDNRTNDYEEPNKPLDGSLVNELRDNRYLNAKAGITSLSSRTEGSLGSIKYTTIEFTVFNKSDFDEASKEKAREAMSGLEK